MLESMRYMELTTKVKPNFAIITLFTIGDVPGLNRNILQKYFDS